MAPLTPVHVLSLGVFCIPVPPSTKFISIILRIAPTTITSLSRHTIPHRSPFHSSSNYSQQQRQNYISPWSPSGTSRPRGAAFHNSSNLLQQQREKFVPPRSPPGPSRPRGVPFRLSPTQAQSAFSAYHDTFFTHSSFAELEELERVYLPFWTGRAEVDVEVVGGEVGFEANESRFNFQTRRWETERVTHWRPIDLPIHWIRTYDASDPDYTFLRRYASSVRPRGMADAVADPEAVQVAEEFGGAMMEGGEGPPPRVEPFTVRPDRASTEMKVAIEARERYEADMDIRRLFNADNTRFVRLRIGLRSFRIAPVYLPAYAFRVRYLGRAFPTLVSGLSGRAAGARFYAAERVAGTTAAIVMLFGAVTGAAGGVAAMWAAGLAVVAGWAARFIPRVILFIQGILHRYEQRAEQMWEETHRGSGWEWRAEGDGWTHGGGAGAGARTGSRSGSGSRGAQAEAAQGSAGDPRGFYKALGVSKNATKEDIQSAFRGLAMKHHPDRFTEPAEKEAATRRFQAISEAYGVLRDATKRREYDFYGRVR